VRAPCAARERSGERGLRLEPLLPPSALFTCTAEAGVPVSSSAELTRAHLYSASSPAHSSAHAPRRCAGACAACRGAVMASAAVQRRGTCALVQTQLRRQRKRNTQNWRGRCSRCAPGRGVASLHACMFAGFGICSRRTLSLRCCCSLECWVHAAGCSADACLRSSWRSSARFCVCVCPNMRSAATAAPACTEGACGAQ
jgi:hypothetical protein